MPGQCNVAQRRSEEDSMISLLSVIYLAFISLGLPDGLLGAGWPSMYPQFNVPVSYAGIVSVIITAGTITSSLMSDRLTCFIGAGRVTAFSVATTAAALFGFSLSPAFEVLCLWAIPYGLGAGGVDAAINNYVAVNYSSRHMNWLHCMWGLGAAVGPYIMGFCIQGGSWKLGYQVVGVIQIALTVVMFRSLPQWKRRNTDSPKAAAAVKLSRVMRVPGAAQIVITFFCYCAIEQTSMLWASTYFSNMRGVAADEAAFYGSLFLIGITVGRFASGFIAVRLNDLQMIMLGMVVIGVGVALLFASLKAWIAIVGFLVMGLGCAPVYPSIIHATPGLFGEDRSQSVVGIEMASAYLGALAMPPLYGFIAQGSSPVVMPVYLAAILLIMTAAYWSLVRTQAHRDAGSSD